LSDSLIRSFINLVIQQPNHKLHFADLFTFRPTGSTVAAIVALLHTVFTMLSVNPYVRVFTLDFSKALDTVRHKTIMEKAAELHMPEQVYNWIVVLVIEQVKSYV